MPVRTAQVEGNIFDGPHQINVTDFNEVAGIYLIVDNNGKTIDVGETENLKDRISNHERVGCWKENCGHFLWFHHEGNAQQRLIKEKHLRLKSNPVCGIK